MNKVRRYFSVMRIGIIEGFQFKSEAPITIIGNIIFFIVTYNLWKSIYASSMINIVNGMTFADTIIYLTFAMAIFNLINMFVVWKIGQDIKTGMIALDIIKPLDYQTFKFFYFLGNTVTWFLIVFLPIFFIVLIFTNGMINIGSNLLFFVFGIIFGIIINYCIDFIVATICLYTESIWGLNITKEVVVMLFSGAIIPISFFPSTLKIIASCLPFQAIYNIPLMFLINNTLTFSERISMLGTQLAWVAIMVLISRLFWKKSLTAITINGG